MTHQNKIYLRYASDLHLEHYGEHHDLDLLPIKTLWDFASSLSDIYYLALVGDIGNPYHKNLFRFFEKISGKYKHIFYIAGNHEYYSCGHTVHTNSECKKEIQTLCQKFKNIYFMDNDIITIDGINFVGSTLWSNVPSESVAIVSKSINDYKYIYINDQLNKKITVDITNHWNADCVNFIRKSLDLVDGPVVILTHHAPLFNDTVKSIVCADPKFDSSQIISAFHNNLDWILDKSDDIIAWIFGHTHYSNKFIYKDITFATNQLGYQSEQAGYSQYAAIELNDLILKKI